MAGLVDITPTVDQVALLCVTRTTGRGGSEVGTFDATTRPTDAQVSDLCDVAARDTLLSLNVEDGELPDELASETLQLATLRAAQLVELSFYPEAAGAESRLAQLTAQFLTGVTALQDRLHYAEFRLT